MKNTVKTREFMNYNILKSNDYSSARIKMNNLLSDYNVVEPTCIFPDFTDSNSLPIGTTTIIGPERSLNPNLIGMDIGCGYNFFSVPINSRRFVKKGKFKERSVSEVVNKISNSVFENRGKSIGNLGKGNHFIDMFVIDELYDERTKIDPKQVYFLIHSGSGTMGFNTSSKFSKLYSNASETNGFNKKYLESFKKVRSFAKSNREELRKLVQRGVSRAVGFDVEYNPIFDKPHNDIEVSNNGSLRYKLMKGTSQLKPGELFVIPGTCVSPAYVVKGLRGLENSHFTINHGSGRKYTRAQIFSKFRRRDFSDLFKGVVLNVPSKKMIEEIPKGYKNIEDVIASVEDAKLVKKVAKLRPVGVVVERK